MDMVLIILPVVFEQVPNSVRQGAVNASKQQPHRPALFIIFLQHCKLVDAG